MKTYIETNFPQVLSDLVKSVDIFYENGYEATNISFTDWSGSGYPEGHISFESNKNVNYYFRRKMRYKIYETLNKYADVKAVQFLKCGEVEISFRVNTSKTRKQKLQRLMPTL